MISKKQYFPPELTVITVSNVITSSTDNVPGSVTDPEW